MSVYSTGNSTPKEKESSKREKLKERDAENVFVQPTAAVQRSPRSLGELDKGVENKSPKLILIMRFIPNNKLNIYAINKRG